MVCDIFKRAFKSGPKLGAHTIRHSIASYLADLTGQPLVVQNFLKHSKIDISMEYIHASEQRKLKMPSPLNMIEDQFSKTTPINIKFIPENTNENSTALTIINPTDQQPEIIETVEAVHRPFRKNVY